jgi:hypothetical protein
MTESTSNGTVQVHLSAEDKKVLDDLLDGSPFPEKILLSVAMRIGFTVIRKDPKVMLNFLPKKQG